MIYKSAIERLKGVIQISLEMLDHYLTYIYIYYIYILYESSVFKF